MKDLLGRTREVFGGWFAWWSMIDDALLLNPHWWFLYDEDEEGLD